MSRESTPWPPPLVILITRMGLDTASSFPIIPFRGATIEEAPGTNHLTIWADGEGGADMVADRQADRGFAYAAGYSKTLLPIHLQAIVNQMMQQNSS